MTALCVKWIGSDLPPFETVSSSAVMCFLALSAILCQQRLPLVRLPPPAPADGQREPLLLPATCGDVEAAGKGLGSACVVAAGRQPSTQQRHPSTARVMGLTLTRAVCGSVATTCFYLALEMLSLKDAVTLFFTSPVSRSNTAAAHGKHGRLAALQEVICCRTFAMAHALTSFRLSTALHSSLNPVPPRTHTEPPPFHASHRAGGCAAAGLGAAGPRPRLQGRGRHTADAAGCHVRHPGGCACVLNKHTACAYVFVPSAAR